MTPRDHVALAEPPSDLTGFPTSRTKGHWYRAHRPDCGSWWFASDGLGRFDLAAPHGTCYLGSHVTVAVRERLGATLTEAGMIPGPAADRFVVSRLPINHALADTTSNTAARFGITRELGTLTPYALPQRWAEALHTCGHRGLRYWSRFALGQTHRSAAVFGHAGEDAARPTDPRPIRGRVACTQAGIAVIGIPRKVTISTPPQS